MPTYDYICKNCGHQIEVRQKITDQPLESCVECQQDTLQRGPGGGIGLSFRGSGFYVTDYKEGNEGSSGACCPCGKDSSSCSE